MLTYSSVSKFTKILNYYEIIQYLLILFHLLNNNKPLMFAAINQIKI